MAFQPNSFFRVEPSPGVLHTENTRFSGVEDSLAHMREALEKVVQENKDLWTEITALKIHIEALEEKLELQCLASEPSEPANQKKQKLPKPLSVSS